MVSQDKTYHILSDVNIKLSANIFHSPWTVTHMIIFTAV